MTPKWVEKKLGDVIELAYGKSLPKRSRKPGEYPVYGSNGVVGKHSEFAVEGPGIIVGRKGSCGAVQYCESDFWPIDTTYYVRLKERANLRFINFLLMKLPLQQMNSHSTIPGLSRDAAYALPVRIPPLDEQERIAARLRKVQQAAELQDSIIQSLQDLKKSTMKNLFTYGLRGESVRPTDFGSIPRSWRIVPLHECCTVQSGVAKGRGIPEGTSIELPYLRVANVQEGYLDLTEMKTIRIRRSEKGRYTLHVGDVVLTEGGDFDKLGRGFVWEGQIADCIHQNHVFAVRVDQDQLLPAYLAYLTQSPFGRKYFLSVAHKTTNLACINITKLKAFPVPIPTIDEQKEITHVIHSVDKCISERATKKVHQQHLFHVALRYLIPEALNGDIAV